MFRKKHFLSVIAIFKDESHCMLEWLSHYQNEGVDHFYLIDNGSTDDCQKILAPFIERREVTLKEDITKWSQAKLYNKYFLHKRKSSEWFIVCDLDEFMYSRGLFKTIKQYLASLSKDTAMLRIPWKVFGSAGLKKQPDSIIQNFLKRSEYNGTINPGMKDQFFGLNKVIVKGKFLKEIGIHHSEISKGNIVGSQGNPIHTSEDSDFHKVSEEILSESVIHMNHYPIQSREWFSEVKAKRGAADWKGHENIRDMKYFDEFDKKSNTIVDDELAKKTYQ